MSRIEEMILACHQAVKVSPMRKTAEEVMIYLVETYDAFEIEDPIRKARMKYYALPEELLQRMNIQMYDVIEDFQILNQFSNDDFNINLKIFELPRNKKTRELYEHATGTILVLFDFVNQTIECINGLLLGEELTIYQGVSQADVDQESKPFLAYCHALKEMGILDDYVNEPFETQANRTIEWLRTAR